MLILFVVLFLFFGARAFICFFTGRAFAGTFATLACLLFLGGIYVDFARQGKAAPHATRQTSGV